MTGNAPTTSDWTEASQDLASIEQFVNGDAALNGDGYAVTRTNRRIMTLAKLVETVKAMPGAAPYYPTLAEAVADLAVDAYFISTDNDGDTAYQDILRTYQRVAGGAGYIDLGDAVAPVGPDTMLAGDGGVRSMRARTAETALELENLAAANPAIGGFAGQEHIVETAPYILENDLFIAGANGAIRNTKATELNVNDYWSTALPIGFMSGQATYNATAYTVSAFSNDRRTLTLGSGEGNNFTIGGTAMIHGNNKYDVTIAVGNVLRFPRSSHMAVIVGRTADTITLKSPVPPDVISDTPVVAKNLASVSSAAYVSGDRTPANFAIVHGWTVENLALKSDKGDPLKWGGCINGRFHNITLDGRHGISLNAMNDCSFTSIHSVWWRAAMEFAQNSRGTTIRGFRGWQVDPSTKFGGASDQGSFIVHIGENSRDCLIDDAVVHAGFCNANANAIVFGPGVNNVITRSTFYLPRYTGSLIGISSSFASNPCEAVGVEHSNFHAGSAAQYFQFRTLSGQSTKKCFLRHNIFSGAVSVRAGIIEGVEGGEVIGNRFEQGSILFNGATEGFVIEGNEIPGGFKSLTRTIINKNIIRNNVTDASKRMVAASVKSGISVISTTVANTPFSTMTIAPGDLAQFDEIHLRLEGYAAGLTGDYERHIRIVADIWGGSPIEVIDLVENTYDNAFIIETVLTVLGPTNLIGFTKAVSTAGPVQKFTSMVSGNTNTHGFSIQVQGWSPAGTSIVITDLAIAGQKIGCANVPVFRGA